MILCARYCYWLSRYLSVCLIMSFYTHLQATSYCSLLSLQKVFAEYNHQFGHNAGIEDLKNYRIKNDQRLSHRLYDLIYEKMHSLDGALANRLETFIRYYKENDLCYNYDLVCLEWHNVPQKHFNRHFSKKLAIFITQILDRNYSWNCTILIEYSKEQNIYSFKLITSPELQTLETSCMTSIAHRLRRGLKELRRTLGKPLSHALTAGAISLIVLNLIKTCTGETLPVDGDQTARLTCETLEELKVSCEEFIMPEKLHAFIQAYLALFVPDLAEHLERHHITLQQLTNTLFYVILNCQSEECLGYQFNNLASCYSTVNHCPTNHCPTSEL